MKFLLNTQEERCRMEVYNEYLRKIPQLLEQLEAVEKINFFPFFYCIIKLI